MNKCYYCDREGTCEFDMCLDGKVQRIYSCQEHMQKVKEDFFSDFFPRLFDPSVVNLPSVRDLILTRMSNIEEKTADEYCPDCFEIVRTYIAPMMKAIHKTYHIKRKPIKNEVRIRILELESQLKNAVKQENYEVAARIKAELEKINMQRKE